MEGTAVTEDQEFRFYVRYSMHGMPITQKLEVYLDAPEVD